MDIVIKVSFFGRSEMAIYESAPVSEVPEVWLGRWSIREEENGDRHFVGFDVKRWLGRVSTKIVEFDPSTRTGVTSSGRRYHLLGSAARDDDAEYVWSIVVKVRKIKQWTDVTAILVPDWRDSLVKDSPPGAA
jgi:hypothetical protein